MCELMYPGNCAGFLAAFVILIILLAVFGRIAYELGLDDGWQQSGNWYDDHAYPLTRDELDARTRPATRDGDA